MFKADHYFFDVEDLRQLVVASAPFITALRQDNASKPPS